MDANWSKEVAELTARAAIREASFNDVSDIELIRVGTNAVFRFCHSAGFAIARVSPSDYEADLLDTQLHLAGWLHTRGFPTSAPLLEQPVWYKGRATTFWELIPSETLPTDVYFRLGELTALFHEMTSSYKSELPEWQPLGRLGSRLDTVPLDDVFTQSDRTMLKNWRDELTSAAAGLRYVRSPGPIHGDIHTGNVIFSNDTLFLIDLDRIERGPREWELTQPLVANQMFSVDNSQVGDFMAGYGWDLREFQGFEVLRNLRALFMTSWLLTLPREPKVKEEIGRRLIFWRNPKRSWPKWQPV